MAKHQVVIIGGGFGGLYAAREFRQAEDIEVTLVDRRNFHLFQPLLYQVATGSLSPANIASPLRRIFRRQKNLRVLLGEAVDFAPDQHEVVLKDGSKLKYDSLILAAGSRDFYFGNNEWEQLAPPLKTIEDATQIRRRIFEAFETAERIGEHADPAAWLRFVIVGGGPTGVELAGALAAIAKDVMKGDFRHINPAQAEILLLDGADRVLTSYPEDLSHKAERSLARLGVTVLTGRLVIEIQPDHVIVKRGDQQERINTHTAIWAAGVQGSPLANKLAERTGCPLSRRQSVVVEPDCSIADHPEIFVVGDLAHFQHGREGEQLAAPLPGVAQTAMQEGRYVAKLIKRRLAGQWSGPFVYRDLGNMAVIGRAAAIADLGWTKFSGFPAWLAWLFIHLINLVALENRILVGMQWAWAFFTYNRAARLITGLTWPQHEAADSQAALKHQSATEGGSAHDGRLKQHGNGWHQPQQQRTSQPKGATES